MTEQYPMCTASAPQTWHLGFGTFGPIYSHRNRVHRPICGAIDLAQTMSHILVLCNIYTRWDGLGEWHPCATLHQVYHVFVVGTGSDDHDREVCRRLNLVDERACFL